jgi:hypothetical protein
LQFKDSDLSHVQVCMARDGGLFAYGITSWNQMLPFRPLKCTDFSFIDRTKVPFFVELWRHIDRGRNRVPKSQTPIKDQMRPKSKYGFNEHSWSDNGDMSSLSYTVQLFSGRRLTSIMLFQ